MRLLRELAAFWSDCLAFICDRSVFEKVGPKTPPLWRSRRSIIDVWRQPVPHAFKFLPHSDHAQVTYVTHTHTHTHVLPSGSAEN